MRMAHTPLSLSDNGDDAGAAYLVDFISFDRITGFSSQLWGELQRVFCAKGLAVGDPFSLGAACALTLPIIAFLRLVVLFYWRRV